MKSSTAGKPTTRKGDQRICRNGPSDHQPEMNPPLPSSSTAQNEIPSGNQASSLSQGRSKLTSQNDVFQNGVY
jgi:hypothetical protein